MKDKKVITKLHYRAPPPHHHQNVGEQKIPLIYKRVTVKSKIEDT